MQGGPPWTSSFSLLARDRERKCVLRYFSQVLKAKQLGGTYVTVSPTHGSWNIDKAATIEPSPTTRTTRGHVDLVTTSWGKIVLYVTPADIYSTLF